MRSPRIQLSSVEHAESSEEQEDRNSDVVLARPLKRNRERSHISSACQNCRLARTRCDGDTPCSRCQRTQSICVYSKEKDGRRTIILRKELSRIRKEEELLNNLLRTLHSSSDEKILQLVHQVRRQGSLEEVKSRIEQQLIILQTAEQIKSPRVTGLHSPRSTTGGERWRDEYLSRAGALQIQRLVDSPPYQVRCSPWTSVTNDDELASNLISVWLTWDKPIFNFVDEGPFLHDMRHRTTPSNYCSPFLVNCLLAWACPFSDYLEARTQRGAISNLMQAFIIEAKRHLEEDMKKAPTLPMVQGLAFLYLTLCVAGQDRLGYPVMVQTIAMCEELERSPPEIEGNEAEAQSLSRAINLTCWGVFHATTYSFMGFMRPQFMRPPKCEPPAPRSQNDSWTPYPQRANPVPAYTNELFRTCCEVTVIAASLTCVIFDEPSTNLSAQEAKVIQLRQQLLDKLALLPDYLRAREGAPAPVLVHHMWYHTVIMRILLSLQRPGFSSTVMQQARSMCIDTALRVSETCRRHTRLYGCEHMSNSYAVCVSLALHILLDAGDNLMYHPAIIQLCICLRALSRRWPMIMGMLRMTQHYAKQIKYNLPSEADRLLTRFENDDWNMRQMRKLISVYPQPAMTTNHRVGAGIAKDMSRFLEEMENLNSNNT